MRSWALPKRLGQTTVRPGGWWWRACQSFVRVLSGKCEESANPGCLRPTLVTADAILRARHDGSILLAFPKLADHADRPAVVDQLRHGNSSRLARQLL